MPTCKHGVEVEHGFFGSGCSQCEKEERDREEALRLQQRSIEIQQEAHERQERLLKEAAWSQRQTAVAEWERLELQREEIRKAEVNRKAEAEREELRKGLPEFSASFRKIWQHAADAEEIIQSRIAELEKLKAEFERKKRQADDSYQTAWQQRNDELMQSFYDHFERGTLNIQDPPTSLAKPHARSTLAEIEAHLRDMPHTLRATKRLTMEGEGPLARIGKQLNAISERVKILTEAPPKKPSFSIGCGAFLTLYIPAVVEISYNKVGGEWAILFVTFLAFIPIAYATEKISTRAKLKKTYLPTKECLLAFNRTLQAVKPSGMAELKFATTDSKQLEQLLPDLNYNIQVTIQNLGAVLFELYTSITYKTHPLTKIIESLHSERIRLQQRLMDIKTALTLSPEDEKTLEYYRELREEIRRIGRLILDGRRFQGAQIGLRHCENCKGPFSDEIERCPYCNGEFLTG